MKRCVRQRTPDNVHKASEREATASLEGGRPQPAPNHTHSSREAQVPCRRVPCSCIRGRSTSQHGLVADNADLMELGHFFTGHVASYIFTFQFRGHTRDRESRESDPLQAGKASNIPIVKSDDGWCKAKAASRYVNDRVRLKAWARLFNAGSIVEFLTQLKISCLTWRYGRGSSLIPAYGSIQGRLRHVSPLIFFSSLAHPWTVQESIQLVTCMARPPTRTKVRAS